VEWGNYARRRRRRCVALHARGGEGGVGRWLAVQGEGGGEGASKYRKALGILLLLGPRHPFTAN